MSSGGENFGRATWRKVRARLAPVERQLKQRVRGEVNVDRLVAQGLELGDRVFIGQGVFLDAGHPWLISIGDDSVITAGTVVLAHDASAKLQTGFTKIGRVSIGKRVFVGAGAVILPGATIGDDSIVGALTVVRGDVSAGSVVIGNPAMVVSDVESFAEKHRVAATHAPVWPHAGWAAGQGITEAHKRAQREALAAGASGYLRGGSASDRAPEPAPYPGDSR